MKTISNMLKFLLVTVALIACLTYPLPQVSASSGDYLQEDSPIVLTWSSTSPTVGDPVTKCTSKAAGGIIGVAKNGSASATESIVVATKGVFDLSVTASVDAIAIGDYIFASVGGINTSTTTLSDLNTGLIFGQALEAIASGETDVIKVRLLQPSHL